MTYIHAHSTLQIYIFYTYRMVLAAEVTEGYELHKTVFSFVYTP